MNNEHNNKQNKKSLDSRLGSSVELMDVSGVMRAMARDYFLAITNITGNQSFINYYRNKIYPLEKSVGHYMDMIELVAYYVEESIMKDPTQISGNRLYMEQDRTRKAEETLYKIMVEPLSYVYDVVKGYQPFYKATSELITDKENENN